MEHEIKIIGVNIVDPTNRVSKRGHSIALAFFDVVANGIEMRGCSFVRTQKYGLTVYPPRLEMPASTNRRSVVFADDSLRAAIIHAVQAAYKALGGIEGDWLPNGDPRRERLDDIFAKPGDPRTGGLARYLADKPGRLDARD